MEREQKIRLGILKILREDREKEFGQELFDRMKELILGISEEELDNALYHYIDQGIVHSRRFGNTFNTIWVTYSLTKRPDAIDNNPPINLWNSLKIPCYD